MAKTTLKKLTMNVKIEKHQLPTLYVIHLTVIGLSSFLVLIKSTCDLTGKCFEMPNV